MTVEAGRSFGTMNMTFNKVIMVIMSCCIVIGAVDYLCGNRWGLGKRFTEGLEAFCPLFLMMGGILAIVPLVEGYVAPLIAPLFRFISTDPGVFPGMLLANDCGAYFLSESLAENRQAGEFGGMLVGAVVGVNVIFNLPVALGMIPEKDRGDVALGFLFGFVTLPIGCLFGGLTMGMPLILLLKQMLPVLMVSAVIGVMLKLYPNALIKAFVVLGKVMTWLALCGIIVAVLAKLLDFEGHVKLATVESCLNTVGVVVIVLPGAYVLVTLLSRLFKTVFTRLGGWLGINEASVLGLLSTLANTIPTFALVKDMDRKGKVLNFAFMTSASFAFADHLAFCTAVAPKLLLPMLVTKLTAAVAAFLLAWCFVQKTESLNP